MTDEEKKSIENAKEFVLNDDIQNISVFDIKIILNLIEKQSKEIEHQKEKRENQKKELAILNAKQIEFNKLVNTVNSYKGQFKRQEKEIEELKTTKKELTERVLRLESDKFWNNVVSKDKIKAKIEEYKWAVESYDCDVADYKQSQAVGSWNVLQSLLEKE